MNKRIVNCRKRFSCRKKFRKIIESTKLHEHVDNRPFVKVKILDDEFTALLDSGASVSVLGKNCLEFIEKNNIKIRPFSSHVSTADGSRKNVLGHCKLPITFKNVTQDINFYMVPSLAQDVYLGVDFWSLFALAPILFHK